MTQLDWCLFAIIGIQQAFFMWQVQKLVDKTMSRSYTEYIRATDPPKPQIRLDDSPNEDLGPLAEFGM